MRNNEYDCFISLRRRVVSVGLVCAFKINLFHLRLPILSYLNRYLSLVSLTGDDTASADRASVTRDLGPQVGALLGDGARDTRSFHVALRVHNHSSVICARQE